MMMHFIEEMSKAERKEYRNALRSSLIAAGGRIYTDSYSGMVLVIEPNISGDNCKSFRVALAYCNPNDKFKKSIGEAIALYRLNSSVCTVIRCESFDIANERMDEIASTFALIY